MTSTKPTAERAGDADTARRAFDRNLRDLRDLFERHSGSVYAAALAATEDPQAAGEITREVFAELWHNRDRLAGRPRSIGSARAWLCAAARDRARDRTPNADDPAVTVLASPGRSNGRRAKRGAWRRERSRVGSIPVHDFMPIEEHHERAGSVLVSGGGSWLMEPAAMALAGSENVAIAFGEPRNIEGCAVIALHWAATTAPFANLEADLQLEPMPPTSSHLTLSGSYEVSSSEVEGNDAITGHHLTEWCVRRFLVGVAVTLERGRAESPSATAVPRPYVVAGTRRDAPEG